MPPGEIIYVSNTIHHPGIYFDMPLFLQINLCAGNKFVYCQDLHLGNK